MTAGDAGVDDVLASLDARVAAENSRLPAAMRAENFGFQIIPTVTSAETDRVRRSVEPVVLALRLLGLACLGGAIVLAGATAHRTIQGADVETKIWSQLGAARSQRMIAVASPAALSIVGGLVGALLAGWLASGIGPVASVSVLDPKTSFGIPAAVIVAVIASALLVLIALLTLSAWSATSSAAGKTSRGNTNRLADAAAKPAMCHSRSAYTPPFGVATATDRG